MADGAAACRPPDEGRWRMGVRALIEQFLKFGVVGALATLIDYGILMVLSQVAGWDPLPASAVSFTVSLVFNYVASMRFVFERRDDLSRRRELAHLRRALAGGARHQLRPHVGRHRGLGDGPLAVTVTKVVATGVVMLWNFASRKRWLEAR